MKRINHKDQDFNEIKELEIEQTLDDESRSDGSLIFPVKSVTPKIDTQRWYGNEPSGNHYSMKLK